MFYFPLYEVIIQYNNSTQFRFKQNTLDETKDIEQKTSKRRLYFNLILTTRTLDQTHWKDVE